MSAEAKRPVKKAGEPTPRLRRKAENWREGEMAWKAARSVTSKKATKPVAQRRLTKGTVIRARVSYQDGVDYKARPCVVLSSTKTTIDVVPIFSQKRSTAERLKISEWKEAGLDKPSYFKVRVETIDLRDSLELLGSLADSDEENLDLLLAELSNMEQRSHSPQVLAKKVFQLIEWSTFQKKIHLKGFTSGFEPGPSAREALRTSNPPKHLDYKDLVDWIHLYGIDAHLHMIDSLGVRDEDPSLEELEMAMEAAKKDFDHVEVVCALATVVLRGMKASPYAQALLDREIVIEVEKLAKSENERAIKFSTISVNKLFGQRDIIIKIQNASSLNFIHSRNGLGKTTIFELLEASFSLNFERMREINFKDLIVSFEDGITLNFELLDESETKKQWEMENGTSNSGSTPRLSFAISIQQNKKPKTTIYFAEDERVARFVDIENAAKPSLDHRLNKWRSSLDSLGIPPSRYQSLESMAEIREKLKNNSPRLFELEIVYIPTDRAGLIYNDGDERSNVEIQIDRVQSIINTAIKAAGQEVLESQTSIFKRLLELGPVTQEAFLLELKKLYSLNQEFVGGPFLESTREIEDELSWTVDKILNNELLWGPASIYIKTITNSLESFRLLNSQCKLFFELMNEKFYDKYVVWNDPTGFQIRQGTTVQGEWLEGTQFDEIRPSHLSLGEQLEMIMLLRLIFQDDEKSRVVLFDEPEIGLHVEWKRKFASDMERIGQNNISGHEMSSVTFLVATHSPTIVNGRLDDMATTEMTYHEPNN